ncbi:hypothetical protein D3C87_1905570 [compost metagenome]
MVGLNFEQPIDLIKHFTVLTGHCDDGRAMARGSECMDQWSHLDRFRSSAIDDEYFAHANFL